MQLDARAVELPFQGGFAELTQRSRHILRGLSEHRSDGVQSLKLEACEPGGSFRQCEARDRAQTPRIHRGAAHVLVRQPGSGRNRIEHYAGKRALAQLADNQSHEKILLGGGGACEQGAEHVRAPGG